VCPTPQSAYLTQLLVEPEYACEHLVVEVVRQTGTSGCSDVDLLLQQAQHDCMGKLCSFMTGPAGFETAIIMHCCHDLNLCLIV